jgi:rubrerythrin
MPEFANPFAGMNAPRKLTKDELVRAIRFDISAVYEATQLYMQLADSTDDKVARAVLRDIAEEEVVHAGEFLRLLKYLEPDEEKSYQKGYKEVEDMIKKLKKK